MKNHEDPEIYNGGNPMRKTGHTYALSVSRENLIRENWQKRLIESGIRDLECSCKMYPASGELKEMLEKLEPFIKTGHCRIASLHLPYSWPSGESPSQPDDFSRNLCVERLKHLIEFLAPLEIKNATLHPGRLFNGLERSEGVEIVRRTVKSLIPTVEKYGMNLNLEICPRGLIGGTPEEMEALVEGMPECVGICFDVNHADCRYAEVPEWIARLGKRIRTFHISDCDGIDECHWFPGFGILDWERIMQEINRLDHDCVLIWEIHQDAFKLPPFVEREADPVWFLRKIVKNMNWLRSLGN